MAVDFSTRATDLDTRIEPAATELRPVDRSGEIDALQQIGRGIGVGARTLATYFQNKHTLDENSRSGKFAYDLSALQDAEAQGIPTGEIRIRGRARYQQELANNPGDVDKINKVYGQWLNNSGYNNIATPAIQKAQIEQKQIDAAVQNGFLSVNDVNNPDKVRQATENLENFQTTVRQLEVDQKQLANQKSRLDLSASERARLDKQTEDNAISGLQKIGAASLPYWRTQYENIKAAAAKAGSEQERQQIIKQGILQLEQDYAQRTAALSGDTLAVNQGKIDQILGPVKGLIDSYKKELSGEYDTDMFNRMSKSAEAQATMQVWTNMTPKARELVAMSQIFKEGAVALSPQLNAEAANYFAQNWGTNKPDANGNVSKPADPLQPDAEGQANVKAYLNGVKTAVNGVQNKTLSDAAAKEVDEQLNAIFKGVDVYGNSSESAKEFQPVIDFLADGTIGQYLSSGGKVDPAVMAKAQQAIADGYQKQVIPLMKEELGRTYNTAGLNKPGTGVGQSMKLGKFEDIVEPVFQNGQVSFKFKDGINLSGTNGPFGDLLLKSLNTGAFVKVFNKMVKANAHAQGNTDYQKSYEELAPLVIPGQEKSNQSGSPDDRKQSSLQEGDMNDLAGMIQPASFIPAEDNPNVDAEVLSRFEGRRLPVSIRNNNMGAISITGDISSSWAAQQQGFVGVSKRPANEGGYYAAYATPEDGVAAASNLLIRYGESGTNTPSKIVKKWSTDKSAHEAYANTLVKYLNAAGYDVDDTTQLDLNDPNVRIAILKAKSAHESGAGKQVYSDSVFQKGVLGESV